MPIHEFQCKACCHCFEALVFPSDLEERACPACGCADVQKLISAGYIRPQGVPTGSGGFKAPACKPSG